MSDDKIRMIKIGDAEIPVQHKTKIRKSSKDLQAVADELGVSPFEILLHAASGNWEALGYAEGSRVVIGKNGAFEQDILTPEIRINAAREAAQYLHAKKRSVEVSGNQDEPLNLKFEGSVFDLLKLARGEG